MKLTTLPPSCTPDEVEAFNYVKNSIVAMLQSPDSLQLARDRIHQILQFWHVKGKVRS
jgi:hypothetical protein